MRDVVWMMDLNLKTIYISPSIVNLTGYSPEEHVKQTIEQRFTKESAKYARKVFRESYDAYKNKKFKEKELVSTIELEYKKKGGGTVWAELNITVVRGDNHEIIGIQGVTRDISERKKAEKELNKYKDHLEELVLQRTQELIDSEERFRSIVQHLTDVIWIIDKNNRIQYATPSTSKIIGYQPADILGRKATDYIHPDDLPSVLKDLEEVYRKENDYLPTEFRVKHADGSWRFMEAVAENLSDHESIRGVIVTVRDISERKKAENTLRESEKKFRNIFNSTTDGISITDINGYFLEVNDIALERAGISREEFLTLNIRDILFSDERMEILQKELIKKGSLTFESDYINRAGKHIFLEICSKVINDRGKQVLLHVTRDISERKELQKQITRIIFDTEERERNRFSKDLHDGLGALLSGIKMYLNLLQKGKLSEKQKEEILGKARDLISQAASSTREIAYNLKPSELDDFGLVPAIDAFIEKIKQFSDITISFKHDNFDAELQEDIELVLYRVINELINNTLKHAEANNIEITLFTQKKIIFLYYLDDGIGFDVDQALKSRNKGMGLNNVISRLKSLNGNFRIESVKNEGTKIIIEVNM
jgi:PAS domain S-box-containing protein